MKKILSFFLLVFFSLSLYSQPIDPSQWPGMVGFWTFDDAQHLTKATVGQDLELIGSDTAVAGPSDNDGATRIGLGSYYKCTHGIAPNGGGNYVNEYSFLVDFRIPVTGKYYCFYQTNKNNSNDGDLFVNPDSHIGLVALGGYSYCKVEAGEWYRLVVSVDLGHHYKIYLDGQLIIEENPQPVDGRFSLDPYFLFFADENGEDNEFDVAAAAVFDFPLSDANVKKLGGYGHVMPQPPQDHMNPYLQVVTDSSVYISWHSDSLSSTIVEYGLDSTFGHQATGSYQTIGGSAHWHTVHLTGLSADTKYYYRCISGFDTSAISYFRTQPSPDKPKRHLRFVLTGDSRTNSYQIHFISTVIEKQLIHDYGIHWSDSIDFLINVGDIVTNGNTLSQYKSEYFIPYSNLTGKIPFYVSIGNHENESVYYYDYMKYEELTGPPFEDPSSQYNEKFYTFRYGRCQFIALNSNVQYRIDVQTNWLKKVLDNAEADPDVDFIFIFNHHPGHTEIWPDGNTDYIQSTIIPLLEQYPKVSMYMYGHTHDYEHGIAEMDRSNSNYRQDMHLVLSGGGGGPLDRWGMYSNQEDYPEIYMSLDHYNYSIIDVDQESKSYTARTFSLGHTDKPLNNVLVDTWYAKPEQAAPDKPVANDPVIENDTITFRGSVFSGVDSLFTSQIQVTSTPGDYSSPLINKQRDILNIYGDTGAPDYTPVNKNEGVDITRLAVPMTLDAGTYAWRIRYRDHNLKWSEWSDECSFTVTGIPKQGDENTGLHIAPNPVVNSTMITFGTTADERVTMKIYSLDNREVAVLLQNKPLPAGRHTYEWKPDDLPAGIYILQLISGNHTATRKIILLNK